MCTVTINPGSVNGLPSSSGNIPLSLTVAGTATDCRGVLVIANGAGPLPADLNEDTGQWSVTFTQGVHYDDQILCGNALKIQAFCEEEEDCKDEFNTQSLPCRPDGQPECPTVNVTANAPGPCIDGTRNVTLSVAFSNGPDVTWAWEFGDGTGSGLQFPGQPQDVQHAYPADPEDDLQYTVVLQVGALGCTGDSVTITIPRCAEEPDCPIASVSATPSDNCVGSTRTVALTVAFSGGPETAWSWDFGDGENSGLLFPGDSLTIEHEYPADPTNSTTYTANLELGALGCAGDSVTFTVAPCSRPACPTEIETMVARVVAGGGVQAVDVDGLACLEPGTYRIRIIAPDDDGFQYGFSIDDELVQFGVQDSLDVSLGDGMEVTLSYTASIDGCPPASGAVTLSACTDCPEQMALSAERFMPEGGTQVVNVEGNECLQPGRYRITVVEPIGAQYDYSWSVDTQGDGLAAQVQSGESGASLIYSLAESEIITITATADAPGCAAISAAVTLEACICPDDVVMTVIDASGSPVDTTACVAPGTYTFTVAGDGVDADNTDWTRNGAGIGNGTVRTAAVTAPAVFCAEVPAGTTMTATVSRADCDPVTVAQTLNVCSRFVFRTCCQIQSLLILVVFGLLIVAVALLACPQVLVAPAAIAIAVAVTPWAVGILAVILIGLLFLWFFTCPPTWCGEVLPLIWQGSFIAGIVFIYFGSCPACGILMLLFGVFLLLVAAGLLMYWIMSCNPTRCQVVWELLRLGLASTIVGLANSVIAVVPLFFGLAMCISPFAIIFLWVINAFLDLLLVILPVVCGFNPIAGGAVANVRRIILPRG